MLQVLPDVWVRPARVVAVYPSRQRDGSQHTIILFDTNEYITVATTNEVAAVVEAINHG